MFCIGILLVLMLLVFTDSGGGVDTKGLEEIFFKANEAYKEGRFDEAISGYLKVTESGHENGHLYYNLANAYLREQDIGRAILYYQRAKLLIPRDGDLKFNLQFAMDQVRDAIGEPRGLLGQTFFWLDGFAPRELLWSFALMNVLFWGILSARLFSRPEWTYYTFLLFLVFWLGSGISLGVKWIQIETDDRCVVLEKEVNVLAGPEAGDTVLFRLHEGALVRSERSEEKWTLIRLQDDKRGWVKSMDIEWILPRRGHAVSRQTQSRVSDKPSTF